MFAILKVLIKPQSSLPLILLIFNFDNNTHDSQTRSQNNPPQWVLLLQVHYISPTKLYKISTVDTLSKINVSFCENSGGVWNTITSLFRIFCQYWNCHADTYARYFTLFTHISNLWLLTSFWEDSFFHCQITEIAWRDSHVDAQVLSISVEFPPHAFFIWHCYNVHYWNKIMKQSALLIICSFSIWHVSAKQWYIYIYKPTQTHLRTHTSMPARPPTHTHTPIYIHIYIIKTSNR